MNRTVENTALLALGVLGYSYVEYAHHVYGGHHKKMGEELYRSHQNHHLDPMEGGVSFPEKLRQRAPLVGKAAAAMAAGLGPLMGARRTGWFMAGMLGVYVYSEWFHHTMHHRGPQNAFEDFMWRYHYIHHFRDSKKNIGFTSPLWDFVMGTADTESPVAVPKSKIPKNWPRDVAGIEVREKKTA